MTKSRTPAKALAEILPAKAEAVNNPSHYGGADNPYETIKVAEAKMLPDEVIGAYKFNIICYLDRHRRKNGLEDLKKAQFYLNRLVAFSERTGAKS